MLSKLAIRAIKDQISYLEDNLYRYKLEQGRNIPGRDHANAIDSHEKMIAELQEDLRRLK